MSSCQRSGTRSLTVGAAVNEIKSVVAHLSSSNETKVYDTLVNLRTKYMRQKDHVETFFHCGGMECLLKIICGTVENATRWKTEATDVESSTINKCKQNYEVEVGDDSDENMKKESLGQDAENMEETPKTTMVGKELASSFRTKQHCSECLQNQIDEGKPIEHGLPKTTSCNHFHIEEMEFSKPKRKLLDICLSIVGNCVLLEERTRDVLVKLNGINLLARLLIACDVESIQNRACRILANIAVDKKTIQSIAKGGKLIPRIVKLLSESEDRDCQQSYVRFFRLVGATDTGREAIINADGLRPIAEKLKSGHEPLVMAAFRATQDLTVRCTNDCVRQVIESDCVTFLVESIASTNKTFSEFALAITLNLAPHDDFRPAFGAADGIQSFINLAKAGKVSQQILVKIVNMLCLCCGESVNRIKMRELGGISLIMKFVKDPATSVLHKRIISSFVCFLYDETSFAFMLENGLMDILMEQMSASVVMKTDFLSLFGQVIDFHSNADEDEFSEFVIYDEESVLHLPFLEDESSSGDSLDTQTPKPSLELESTVTLAPSVGTPSFVGDQKGPVTYSTECSLAAIEEQEDFNLSHTNNVESSKDVHKDIVETSAKTNQSAEKGHQQSENEFGLSNPTLGTTDAAEPVRYSIDSPTYEPIEWNYTEYSKGAKCKTSFSTDPPGGWSPGGASWSGSHTNSSPNRSSCYSPAFSSPRSSYSPLSNSSFQSPTGSPVYGPTYSPPSSPYSSSSDSNQMTPATKDSVSDESIPHYSGPVKQLVFSPEREVEFDDNIFRIPKALNTETTVASHTDMNGLSLVSKPDNPDLAVPDNQAKHVLDVSSKFLEQNSSSEHSTSGCDSVMISSSFEAIPATSQCTKIITNETVTSERVLSSDGDSRCAVSTAVEKSLATKSREKPIIRGRKIKAVKGNLKQTNIVSNPLSVLDLSDTGSEVSGRYQVSGGSTTIVNILTLMSRISHMDNPCLHLLNSRCIDLLFGYISFCPNPLSKAWRILVRLARNPICFEKLLDMDMPLKLSHISSHENLRVMKLLVTHEDIDVVGPSGLKEETFSLAGASDFSKNQIDTTEDLKKETSQKVLAPKYLGIEAGKLHEKLCEEVRNAMILVAESRYGQELILKKLVKSRSNKSKLMCAINIVYLCRSQFLQAKLLLKGSALDLLFEELNTDNHLMRTFVSHSLVNLGTCLRTRALEKRQQLGLISRRKSASSRDGVEIRCDKIAANHVRKSVEGGIDESKTLTNPHKRRKVMPSVCKFHNMDFKEDVTFCFDDGCTVRTNRNNLSSKSTVFKAMLEGFYSESEKAEISLSDVKSESFEVMLHFLHNCSSHCPLLSQSHLMTCLESLRLGDKYLLNDFKDFAIGKLEGLISCGSVGKIVDYAAILQCNQLLNKCVFFILFSKMPTYIQMRLMLSVLDTVHREEVLNTMKQLITKIIL